MDVENNLKKSIIPGLYMALLGMILQVTRGAFILKSPPPTTDFIIKAAVCYFLMAYFFAFGFFVFYKVIPGKSRFEKSFKYSLGSYLCAFLPGLLGVIAFDFVGGTDLFTTVKIADYSIAITDFINLVLGGTLMGFFIEKKKYESEPLHINLKLIMACITGMVFYPTFNFFMHIIINHNFPYDYSIPDGMVVFHFAALYGVLCLSGLLLPIFYILALRIIKPAKPSATVVFTVFFFVCLWLANIGFLFPFGFSFSTVIKFWIETVVSIFLTTSIISRMLKSSY